MLDSGGYFPIKIMKRKELHRDEVSGDMHDFSLTSPATKIRRLNAQLPVSEEIVPEVSDPLKEERAIVLYKPVNSSSPSNVSVNLDYLNLVSGIKNEFVQASQSRHMKTNKCLAVIPWVLSQSQTQFPHTPGTKAAPDLVMEAEDEAEEAEMVQMDIEDSNTTINMMYEYGGGMRDDQWLPQQHCMISPQLPPRNTSTPITWFRNFVDEAEIGAFGFRMKSCL